MNFPDELPEEADGLKTKREDKELLLKQHAKVFWFTGLSGAGKTTLAQALDDAFQFRGFICQLLDGDIIRKGINNNLGFSEVDRFENIRRIAEVSKLFNQCGIITINSFISPTRNMREMARSIIGTENFIEVYINAPLAICEQRDIKGLYSKARKGEIKDFTGIHAPYEPPLSPDIEIKTDVHTIQECMDKLIDFCVPLVRYPEASL
jgi:adenylylsulfate kinase